MLAENWRKIFFAKTWNFQYFGRRGPITNIFLVGWGPTWPQSFIAYFDAFLHYFEGEIFKKISILHSGVIFDTIGKTCYKEINILWFFEVFSATKADTKLILLLKSFFY